MSFSYKNKKYRGSNTSRGIITILVTILLSAGALLGFPYFLFAASENSFTGGGICDSREKDEDLWAKGYCLAFDAAKHQILGDTVINELRRYSISVTENVDEAKKAFLDRRQAAIDEKVSIGGSGWKKIEPEDVSIGDAGFMEIAKLPRGGYVGAFSNIPDTDNAEEGYFDRYTFDPVFLQGRCVVSWVFLGTITYNEAYKTNHREEAYRDSSDHVRYRLINSHPASNHSLREETKTVIISDLQNLASRLAPACGGAMTEATTLSSAYFKYQEINRILDSVPLPEIPNNVTYEQCNKLCSNLDDQGYHGRLVKACEENKSYLEQIYGYSECSTVAYQKMSACWSNLCGLTRILAGSPDGSMGGIIRLDDIEKTTGVPLDERTAEYIKAQTGKTPADLLGRPPAIDPNQPIELPVEPSPSRAAETEGDTSIMLPGSDKLIPLKKGDPIPYGSRVLTGQDGVAVITIPGQRVLRFAPFSDAMINQGATNVRPLGVQLNLGELEILRRASEQNEKNREFEVSTPESVAGVRGTHFWVSYDKNTHVSVVGVYEGEVELTANATGEKTILKPVGNRSAVAMVVPSQKTIKAEQSSPTQETGGRGLVWLIIMLIAGSGVFVLHKTGKLKPILQKVLALIRRDNSKPL